MYETETAFLGEIEIETPYGRLLAHRQDLGEIILTTGLDRDRLVIGGRRVFAHQRLGTDEWRERGAVFDVQTGRRNFPAWQARPEDMLDRQAAMEFVEACRTAIKGIRLPYGSSEAAELVSQYRENGRKILEGVADARAAKDNYESVKEFHDHEVSSRSEFSALHAREVATKWGSVRFSVEHGDSLWIKAGLFEYPAFERRRGLFGRQRMMVFGWADWNPKTNEVGLKSHTDSFVPFKITDEDTDEAVRPQSLHDEIAREIVNQVQSYILTHPGFREEVPREKKVEMASREYGRIDDAMSETQKAARERIELKARIGGAILYDKGMAELLEVMAA